MFYSQDDALTYDDVLLVDTYTGEVIDVIYNFFW